MYFISPDTAKANLLLGVSFTELSPLALRLWPLTLMSLTPVYTVQSLVCEDLLLAFDTVSRLNCFETGLDF